jgi:hypothetical protein
MSKQTKDRLGLRYGRLVVIGSIHVRGLGTGWECLCDCGQKTYAAGNNLETGNTTSCGCFHAARLRTHGKTKSRVYTIWKGMRRRCQSPKALEYRNYGARGISVCERWQTFENFLSDMGEPEDGLTIERINNDGNYEPSNCKWASYKDQLNNRRNNHYVSAFGRRRTLTQWSEEMNIPTSTIKNRLYRAKLSPEEALRKKE